MGVEPSETGQDAPKQAKLACLDDGPFLTQSERAALADASERTQKRSDRYEDAGLGPEIRDGSITGVEAELRVRDPDAPRPLTRVQHN